MSKFLIQAIDGEVGFDFGFHLIQAVKYNNWYYDSKKYDYLLAVDPLEYNYDGYIPIGSVEFVLDFYKKYHKINNIKPINIPQELMREEYLKRWIGVSKSDKSTLNSNNVSIFVKDNTKIKGFTDIISPNSSYPPGEYLISEVVDIDSEWRGFVYRGELLDLRRYSGDYWRCPDFDMVGKMVYDYKNCPIAYTIDVGVSDRGTFIIECHQFFSCGLYGFADYRVLPQMFASCHNEVISRVNS